MRWLLVLISCCFCCLAYATMPGCPFSCGFDSVSTVSHDSKNRMVIECQKCGQSISSQWTDNSMSEFLDSCSYTGDHCSVCNLDYCKAHTEKKHSQICPVVEGALYCGEESDHVRDYTCHNGIVHKVCSHITYQYSVKCGYPLDDLKTCEIMICQLCGETHESAKHGNSTEGGDGGSGGSGSGGSGSGGGTGGEGGSGEGGSGEGGSGEGGSGEGGEGGSGEGGEGGSGEGGDGGGNDPYPPGGNEDPPPKVDEDDNDGGGGGGGGDGDGGGNVITAPSLDDWALEFEGPAVDNAPSDSDIKSAVTGSAAMDELHKHVDDLTSLGRKSPSLEFPLKWTGLVDENPVLYFEDYENLILPLRNFLKVIVYVLGGVWWFQIILKVF